MKNFLFRFWVIVALFTSGNKAMAQSATINDVWYSINGSEARVVGCEDVPNVSILNSIVIEGIQYDVTSIAENAFFNKQEIRTIEIPKGITLIGASSFQQCYNLISINIPEGVTTINNQTFYGCKSLNSIIIPKGVTRIGKAAFAGCTSLKTITFQNGDISIDYNAFQGCTSIRTFISNATSFSNSDLSSSNSFLYDAPSIVVYAPEGTYNVHKEKFPNNIVIDGSINEADVTVTVPGTLGEEVLNQVEYVRDVNSLKVRGTLNDDDIACINESMINLLHLDLSDVEMQEVTSIGHSNLYSIVLPKNCKTISGFSNRRNLTSVSLSEGVETISNECFKECINLEEIIMGPNLKHIGASAFYNCSSLSSITIPEGVTAISANTFQECSSLKSVELHDCITDIGYRAFYNCESLSALNLPATLRNCHSQAFCNSGLTEMICPSFFPPIAYDDIIEQTNSCTLYVPEWTINRYKLSNWELFASIQPINNFIPDHICVYTQESLAIPDSGVSANYKPSVELIKYNDNQIGRLTVRGETPLSLSSLKIEQTRMANTMTSLVNYATLMADSVVTKVNMSTNTWHYLAFPYDVKITDITTMGDWVIRRYDGAARAEADFDHTWKTVPYDSILHAGEGYIWYSTNGNFTVPAINNINQNLIFTNETRYTQLSENASTTAANYGWNLIGNPYPCFYDTRFIEYTSPITVRSGNSYAAYSPVDDSYILSPLEAFFVQCSTDNNVVTFGVDGRQVDNTVRTITTTLNPTRGMNNNRCVFNLYLENENSTDHTRFVINENALPTYEISCDAAKFMSDDPNMQQIFTIEKGERMAINERPLGNGEITLGVHFGCAGNYNIVLDTRVEDMEVILVDQLTGIETNLMTDNYSFTTNSTTDVNRFIIRIKRTVANATKGYFAAKVKIVTTVEGINIMNATESIYLYNSEGVLIDTKNGNAVTFNVPKGTYVIKIGSKVYKVFV